MGDRSVYRLKLDPCPGLRSLSEEMFFTESRIVKLDEILQHVKRMGGARTASRKGVSESAESFSDLKGLEKISVATSITRGVGDSDGPSEDL